MILRRIAVTLATIYAVWLAVVHLFLWTPLLRKLIEHGRDNIHLDYHFAYSLWPGTVHASGVVLTVQDHMQQFRLAIDEVTATVALLQLPRRIFHCEKVRAKGITYAMRRRLAPGQITQEALVGLPQIDNFPAIPFKEYIEDDPVPDFRYKIFTVWLEDIKGEDVREIWFDKFRLQGHASVAGAFYLKPIREVYVAPGLLHIDDAALREDGHPIAEAIHGDVEFDLDHTNPRKLPLETFFQHASLKTNLQANVLGLEFLKAKGGAGKVDVKAHLDHGKVASDNDIDIELADTSYDGFGVRSLQLHVESTLARVALKHFRMPGATIEKSIVVLKGDPPDLADLKLPKKVAADLLGGKIEDAHELAKVILPSNVDVVRGSGNFMLHLEEQGAGVFQLSVKDLAVDARGELFHADVDLDAHIANASPSSGADLSGTTVRITDAGIAREPNARTWWGHVTLPRAGLRFDKEESVDADLIADCRDARPILGLYARLKKLPGVAQSLFTMDGLHVWGSGAGGKGWLTLRSLHASGKGAEIRAVFQHQHEEEQGAVWFKVGILPLAIGLGQGGGLHILHPGDYFTARKATLGRAPKLSSLRYSVRRHK